MPVPSRYPTAIARHGETGQAVIVQYPINEPTRVKGQVVSCQGRRYMQQGRLYIRGPTRSSTPRSYNRQRGGHSVGEVRRVQAA